MSRDALHAEVFGILQHESEPQPPLYRELNGVNNHAYPFIAQRMETAVNNSTTALEPKADPKRLSTTFPPPVQRSWTLQSLHERFVEERRISVGDLLKQGVYIRMSMCSVPVVQPFVIESGWYIHTYVCTYSWLAHNPD